MAEPSQLRQGKWFHDLVQLDWEKYAEGEARSEVWIPLGSGKNASHGRMDVFIDVDEPKGKDATFVVVEIKATCWDNIKPHRIQPNLSSHRRQIWKYINTYIVGNHPGISAGIIYPTAPKIPGLKERIEEYLLDYGLMTVWYFDDNPLSKPSGT